MYSSEIGFNHLHKICNLDNVFTYLNCSIKSYDEKKKKHTSKIIDFLYEDKIVWVFRTKTKKS